MCTQSTAVFLALLSVSFGQTLNAQTTTTTKRLIVTASALPSAQDIVNRALVNDDLRRQHRLGWVCNQIITTERIDDKGEVFKSKTVHRLHREGEGLSFSHEASLEGRDDHHGHHDGDTVKAEHRMALLNLRQLAPHFQYTLNADATLRGRTCYVVAFSPHGEPPADTREMRVINHLQGRFWIDKQTFEILQGEGSLPGPVSVSLFGSVTQLDFAFGTQPLPNGEVGPADFHVDLSVKAPFYFYRQQQTTRMENWRASEQG